MFALNPLYYNLLAGTWAPIKRFSFIVFVEIPKYKGGHVPLHMEAHKQEPSIYL